MYRIIAFLIIATILNSCSQKILPEQITSFSNEDLLCDIYYQNIEVVNKNQEKYKIVFGKAKLDDSHHADLHSSEYLSEIKNESAKTTRIIGSYSNSGKYLADYEGHELKHELDNKYVFNIYSVYDARKVLVISTEIPKSEYSNEEYELPWSKTNDAIFIFNEKCIKKVDINQTETVIYRGDNIVNFSVSNNDSLILVQEIDSMFLYNRATKEKKLISLDDDYIIVNEYVRGMSWSDDDDMVVFSNCGWLYIHDVATGNTIKYTSHEPIFHSSWISNKELLFVAGNYPVNEYVETKTEYFKIYKIAMAVQKVGLLYTKNDFQPFSVKPRLSPSKKCILFSTGKEILDYNLTLLSIDGRRIKQLWKGQNPQWIKNPIDLELY